MPAKKNLADALRIDEPLPEIRRGQGIRLSTEATANAEAQNRTIAETQKSTYAQSQDRTIAETQNSDSAETQKRKNADMRKRINRGYALREDLIKACKRIALEEDRNLYEVMEEALEEYLEKRQNSAE